VEKEHPIHGIGLYSTWVHVDSRGYRVLWKDSGTNVKGSFFIGDNYKLYKAPEPAKQEDDDMMTDKEIYEAVQRHAKTMNVPEWAKKSFQEAIDAGITDGSDPCALIPRYQAAIMALRAMKKAEE
jgi:hypothetical protein